MLPTKQKPVCLCPNINDVSQIYHQIAIVDMWSILIFVAVFVLFFVALYLRVFDKRNENIFNYVPKVNKEHFCGISFKMLKEA